MMALGDILSKITLKSGVGTIVETGSDDGHFMAVNPVEVAAPVRDKKLSARRILEDPLEHCAAGNSLLLTSLPGTGKTYLVRKMWRGSVSRAKRCTWCRRRIALRRTWGSARRRPTTGCAGTSATGACKNLTGSWLRRSPAGHGALGGPGVRGAEPRREVPAAWQLPAARGAGLRPGTSAPRWSIASWCWTSQAATPASSIL